MRYRLPAAVYGPIVLPATASNRAYVVVYRAPRYSLFGFLYTAYHYDSNGCTIEHMFCIVIVDEQLELPMVPTEILVAKAGKAVAHHGEGGRDSSYSAR